MTTREAPSYTPDAILTVKEAAEYLKLSQSTIRSFCNLDEDQPDRIPNWRIGTSIRIPFWGLLIWIGNRSGSGPPPTAPSKKPRHRRMMRAPKPRRILAKR